MFCLSHGLGGSELHSPPSPFSHLLPSAVTPGPGLAFQSTIWKPPPLWIAKRSLPGGCQVGGCQEVGYTSQLSVLGTARGAAHCRSPCREPNPYFVCSWPAAALVVACQAAGTWARTALRSCNRASGPPWGVGKGERRRQRADKEGHRLRKPPSRTWTGTFPMPGCQHVPDARTPGERSQDA